MTNTTNPATELDIEQLDRVAGGAIMVPELTGTSGTTADARKAGEVHPNG